MAFNPFGSPVIELDHQLGGGTISRQASQRNPRTPRPSQPSSPRIPNPSSSPLVSPAGRPRRATQLSRVSDGTGPEKRSKVRQGSVLITEADHRAHTALDEEAARDQPEDALDAHIIELVQNRKQRRVAMARRMWRGAWAFLKTPLGVVFAIYGFLVVFWVSTYPSWTALG